MKSSLILHAGGSACERAEVDAVRTPQATETWYPIPHSVFIDEILQHLTGVGYEIIGEQHALSRRGQRYFGLFEIGHPSATADDYGWVVGCRNSHDKSYPAGLASGTRVFVCDNLAFNGEIRLSRRHTKHALTDLRRLTNNAVGQLESSLRSVDERIRRYKALDLEDRAAHDLLIQAVDCGAIPSNGIRSVLQQWRRPAYEDFAPRTLWSLFNAFTHTLKHGEANSMLRRTVNLHNLMDSYVELN